MTGGKSRDRRGKGPAGAPVDGSGGPEAGDVGGEAVSPKAGAAGVGGEDRAAGAADDATATRESDAGAGEAAAPEPEALEAARATEAADAEAAQDTEPGGEPSGATAASLADELAEARRTAQEHLDRALRAQAELENVRRRMERNVESAHKYGLERFVSELLPVKDSLELALAASAGEEAGTEGIAEGVRLTLRMLEQAMEKFGVRVIDPAGEPFDPAFHQVMTMQESDGAESGSVITVFQKGYLLNDRLVRPAMVIIAK